MTGHTGGLWSVTFSPNGRTLATAGTDSKVILWDITDPIQPHRLGQPLTDDTSGVLGGVHSVAFAPDGRTLAAASVSGKVTLWDLTEPGRPRHFGQPLTNAGSMYSLAFAPDGHTLATASDNTALLWDFANLNDIRDHATERACSTSGRGLNRDEWSRYIPGLAYQNTCPS
jgi:WD40 repeat protein